MKIITANFDNREYSIFENVPDDDDPDADGCWHVLTPVLVDGRRTGELRSLAAFLSNEAAMAWIMGRCWKPLPDGWTKN